MVLRLEITSVDRDFSRAFSLSFSTTSVYTLLVSRRAEPVCITERLARVQVEHKMTQSEEDPGHEVYPQTDAQIKLLVLMWCWKAAFGVIDSSYMHS